MTREGRERTAKINKVRKYDSMVGININDKAHSAKKNDERYKKAYAEFKRDPYGVKKVGGRNEN